MPTANYGQIEIPMQTIAILTIQSINYGNRLQNYALQSVLASLGYEVVSLRKERRSILTSVRHRARKLLKDDSVTRFREFDETQIRFSDCVASTDYVTPGLTDRYDKFVIGSDQVWNPNFPFLGPVDYLPFVDSAKKVAYAASFGVSSLGDREGEVSEYLADIPHISMRESEGAEITSRLTGRNVPVVLDPTMLLTVNDWFSIAKRPEGIEEGFPFVFKYVLGTDASGRAIRRMAGDYGAVVDVRDPSLKVGPAEFVWLIQNCTAVCTDSFHASAFALLHHKPLGIFDRVDDEADMSSRFDTLCELFGAERCRTREEGFDMRCMDWSAFELRLAELREASLSWLRMALGDESSDD